mgnify:CR=1 FL=1
MKIITETTNEYKLIGDFEIKESVVDDETILQLGFNIRIDGITDIYTDIADIPFKLQFDWSHGLSVPETILTSDEFTFDYTPAWSGPKIQTAGDTTFTNVEAGSLESNVVSTASESELTYGFALDEELETYEEITAVTDNQNVIITEVVPQETNKKLLNLTIQLRSVEHPGAQEELYNFSISFTIKNKITQETTLREIKNASGQKVQFTFKYVGYESQSYNFLLTPTKLVEAQTTAVINATIVNPTDPSNHEWNPDADKLKAVKIVDDQSQEMGSVTTDWEINKQQPVLVDGKWVIPFNITVAPDDVMIDEQFTFALQCTFYDDYSGGDKTSTTATITLKYIHLSTTTDNPEQFMQDRMISVMSYNYDPDQGTYVTSFSNGWIYNKADDGDYKYNVVTTWNTEQYYEKFK